MSFPTPHVHKFGGAALIDGASVRHVATIVAGIPGCTVVTVSAMATVTDTLFDLAVRAQTEDVERCVEQLDTLRRRHEDAWRTACPGVPPSESMVTLCAAAERLVRSIAEARVLTPRMLDAVVALGERLSARLVTGALRAAGVDAEYVDATAIVCTDGHAGHAVPDIGATTSAARASVTPLLARGCVPVIPGYLGAAPDGTVVTLGRGGTDLTATTLAVVLDATEVVLWKDVPGFLTADPRVVPGARIIPELHVREAAELAYYGAKVLHPRAFIPLRNWGGVIRIKPFAEPSASGTRISREDTGGRQPVRAVSAMNSQALVTVSGNGMLGGPGIATRTFSALQRAGLSVSLISQASSEHSISVGIPAAAATTARQELTVAFANELANGTIDGVDVRTGVATIAVVGLGMAGQPGIAARLFTALGKRGINVIAIAQGSAELNISVVVDEGDVVAAQRAVHDEFQLGKIGGGHPASHVTTHTADVILLGFGQIGRALTTMLGERIARGDRTSGAVRIVGVIDRSGFIFDPHGLPPARLADLVRAKLAGRGVGHDRDHDRDRDRNAFSVGTSGVHPSRSSIGTPVERPTADALAHMLAHALTRPILVDVTADETTPLLEAAVAAGADLVLANKRPVGGGRARAESLRLAVERHGRRLLHEATVGAGLPILDTFAKLVEAGDTVRMIEGCPSGTMGYLFGELGRGTLFSAALRGAMRLGYTEPDPRDDLSGADVARKALILGRLLGFDGEYSDVRVESLVPADAVALSLADFLGRLETYDAAWAARIEEARTRGTVLRYRATATRDAVTVGLVEVAAGSSLGALGGTDNQFSFTTDRYDTNPLVITGPGAGPAVTAAGVLNDILKLAGALS